MLTLVVNNPAPDTHKAHRAAVGPDWDTAQPAKAPKKFKSKLPACGEWDITAERLAELDRRQLERDRKDKEFIAVLKIKQTVLTNLREDFPQIADCTTGLGHLDGFLVVLSAKGCWHGLQLKILEKRNSDGTQADIDPLEAEWLAKANQNGFAGCVATGYTEAMTVIVNYWFARENEVKAHLFKG